MKVSEFRKLIREEIRKIISESSKNKNRKHTFESFDEFLNENFRIDSNGETLLSKMNIDDANGKWVLNIVDLDDDGDEYIVITGKFARSTTSEDTVWIPKTQWAEFKKMINSI